MTSSRLRRKKKKRKKNMENTVESNFAVLLARILSSVAGEIRFFSDYPRFLCL